MLLILFLCLLARLPAPLLFFMDQRILTKITFFVSATIQLCFALSVDDIHRNKCLSFSINKQKGPNLNHSLNGIRRLFINKKTTPTLVALRNKQILPQTFIYLLWPTSVQFLLFHIFVSNFTIQMSNTQAIGYVMKKCRWFWGWPPPRLDPTDARSGPRTKPLRLLKKIGCFERRFFPIYFKNQPCLLFNGEVIWLASQ